LADSLVAFEDEDDLGQALDTELELEQARSAQKSKELRLGQLKQLADSLVAFQDEDELGQTLDTELEQEKVEHPIGEKPELRYEETESELPRFLFFPQPLYRRFAANTAGDYGFDPLGFSSNIKEFIVYREAELKHGRICMFAAVAWPLAEFLDLDALDSDDPAAFDFLADSGGKVLPSLTGGEQDTFVEIFAAVIVASGSFFELFWARGKAAGDRNFDLFKLNDWKAPPAIRRLLPRKRPWMAEAEVQHCRLAMVALLFDVLVELGSDAPVLEGTEFIFHKIDARLLTADYWSFAPALEAGPDVDPWDSILGAATNITL